MEDPYIDYKNSIKELTIKNQKLDETVTTLITAIKNNVVILEEIAQDKSNKNYEVAIASLNLIKAGLNKAVGVHECEA